MSDRIRITILAENTVHRRGLTGEHGLSFHIQINQHSLLFDTGQTGLALQNAQALGIQLHQLEAIVLSHGHYDHTGGLPAVLGAAPNARIYLHPAAWEEKHRKTPDSDAQFIGMSQEAERMVRSAARGFVETSGLTPIFEGISVTGEIPRTNSYEDTGGPFFLDTACQRPDPLADDQALVIDLESDIILLLGCAHSGVVNTLDYVQQLTGGKPVRAVIGGMHLGSASEERVEKTISRLRAAKLHSLAPVHCTGWPATAKLWQAFPEIFRPASVGTAFEF